MMTLSCCQDHFITENIWFVWSQTSYSGDKWKYYWCGMDGQTDDIKQGKIEQHSLWTVGRLSVVNTVLIGDSPSLPCWSQVPVPIFTSSQVFSLWIVQVKAFKSAVHCLFQRISAFIDTGDHICWRFRSLAVYLEVVSVVESRIFPTIEFLLETVLIRDESYSRRLQPFFVSFQVFLSNNPTY